MLNVLILFIRRSGFGLVVAAALAATGHADSVSLTLDDAVDIALRENRSLRAAYALLKEAEAGLHMAGRWSNPDFSLSVANDTLFNDAGERAFSIGLEQTFPVTARLSLARDAGRLDVARALRKIRNVERLLIEQVQKAYISLLSARERALIWGEAAHNAAQALALAEQRAGVGQAPSSEAALARADYLRAQREYLAAESDADGHLLALASLLGHDVLAAVTLAESSMEIVEQLDAITDIHFSAVHRPDADMLEIDEKRAGVDVALARAESWEGVRIGVAYMDERSTDQPGGLGDDQYLGITLTTPLPLWSRSGPVVAEREARRGVIEARREAVALELTNEMASRRQLLARLRQQVALYGEAELDEMTKSEQSMAQWFAEGRIDVRDLTLMREYLVDFKLARVKMIAELAEALVEWQAATGTHPAVRRPYENDVTMPDQETLP
jgi:cobalt-zinc-cadmium efflux system outer membrane protein